MIRIEPSTIAVLAAATALLTACGGGDLRASQTVAKLVSNIQCEAPRTTLLQLDAELSAAGVDVRARSCAWDGTVFPAVCGAPSTYLRVIDIPLDQVGVVRALGYRAPGEFNAFLPASCPSQ